MGRKGLMEPLPHVNTRLDIQVFEDPVSQLIPSKGDVDPSQTSVLKSAKFNSESRQPQTIPSSVRNEEKLYPGHFQGSNPVLLEAPVDASPLIRSNSMPTSSATNLSIPPSLRGSHSFDERMAGSDDVFYPGTVGIPLSAC